MSPLEEIIRAGIVRDGPMRFDRFMELALYHPEHGYYRRGGVDAVKIGRAGDFFTSVSVGPLFGRLLARQFLQMWELLGRPASFRIIEQGAGDGQLALDILDWCRVEAPPFFAAVHYAIIEPYDTGRLRRLGAAHREIGELLTHLSVCQNLPLHVKSRGRPTGVFFSNELADAFPVRAIRFSDGAWCERHVALEGDALGWIDRAITDKELAGAVAALPLPPIEGYTTEINLRARHWLSEVARELERGYVLTLDYGYPAPLYYADFRSGGTLTAYQDHRRGADVLAEPGSRDITAHVDFTALAHAGESAGLATLGFTDQQHFLMGVAHDELTGAPGPRAGIADNARAWMTLIHPEHLGARFHALLQGKDAPAGLDGLRFAKKATDL